MAEGGRARGAQRAGTSEARALTLVVVCAGKVGMRYFHKKGNLYFCPTVNLDKIWTLVGDDVRKAHASKTDVAPVIDVTKYVRPRPAPAPRPPARCRIVGRLNARAWQQGYFKVLGKGVLPSQPVIVKAKFFSKSAEDKIKEAGGACVLVA